MLTSIFYKTKFLSLSRKSVLFLILGIHCLAGQADELLDPDVMQIDQSVQTKFQEPDFLLGYAGGLVIHSQRVVGHTSDITLPVPVFGINYKDKLFWNMTKGGAWLWKSKNRSMKLGPMLKLRLPINHKNDPQLSGLQKRKGSLEGGFGFAWSKYIKTSVEVYQDISDRSGGASMQLKLSKSIKASDDLNVIPLVAIEWLSSDVVNYYYGVTALESTATSMPAYKGSSATITKFGITLAAHFSPHWILLGGAINQRYSDGIVDSPIVSRSSNTAVYLGTIYFFLHI